MSILNYWGLWGLGVYCLPIEVSHDCVVEFAESLVCWHVIRFPQDGQLDYRD